MKPMLTQVLEDLAACKGAWAEIAREMEPDNTVSFYSWLTKLAQGTIREPSVNRIQRLFDYFRARALNPTPEPPPAPSRPHPLPASGQGVNTASPIAAVAQTVEAGQGGGGKTAYEASTFISSNEAA
ncbi:hypothetical protein [Thauera aromatica]|uniref:hypothetical protein n=1 Tax=Thauera aromatica TaxID=59405 RepID=UPI001FFCEF96|nr:hypothetical protein [Thauera aromatica]MCK2095205.1 hypothetical protein [Thauera aromatica]